MTEHSASDESPQRAISVPQELPNHSPSTASVQQKISAISELLREKISVPKEFIPYLRRINSNDIKNYLENQAGGLNGEKERWTLSNLTCEQILHMPQFDGIMGIIILANLVVMIVEVDRANSHDAHGVMHWTEFFGWIVLVIFVIELLMRLLVFRMGFWRDAWNIFDLIVVSVDFIFSLFSLVAGIIFPVSALRTCRLAKLGRLFKVLRVFPQLRLLLAGLVSSISAIFWGTLLLSFCILLWAMMGVLFIQPVVEDIDYGDSCERCPRAYSTVFQAMMTIWQAIVTGDSWGQVSIPLVETYPATAIYFVTCYLTVGMTVTNLILGVVVNVAHQAVAKLSEEDDAQAALAKFGKHTQLLDLCKHMDTDASGELSRDEIYAAMAEPGPFRETILALDVTSEDFDIIWTILDENNSGSVSYKEFVSKLSTMKITDSEFMLSYVKYYITLLKNSLLEKLESQHAETMDIERRVEQDLQIIEEEVEKEEQDLQIIGQDLHSLEKEVLKSHRGIEGVQSMSSACQSKSMFVTPLDDLRDDIATMRMEIKDMLLDIHCKLGPRLATQELDLESLNLKSARQLTTPRSPRSPRPTARQVQPPSPELQDCALRSLEHNLCRSELLVAPARN